MFVNFFSNLATAAFGFFIVLITGIIGILAFLATKYRQQEKDTNQPTKQAES